MGKVIVITAGGTSENIDAVRKITNISTGKLGSKIHKSLLERSYEDIDKIYYICTSNAIKPEIQDKTEQIIISDANDLLNVVKDVLTKKIDIFIHAMAVSDYTVEGVIEKEELSRQIAKSITNSRIEDIEKLEKNILSCINEYKPKSHKDEKMSSNLDDIVIKLKKAPKVISIIKDINQRIFLVGFKLLNDVPENELYEVGFNLLKKNNCDLVVANDLTNINEIEHKAIIIEKNGGIKKVNTKTEIAEILTKILFP